MLLPDGVIASFPTPFKDDGSVDEDSIQDLIEYGVEGNVDGALFLGYMGEEADLSTDERMTVTSCAADIVRGLSDVSDIALLVGVTGATPDETLALARYTSQFDSVQGLVVQPSRIPHITQVRAYALIEQVATEASLPLTIYENSQTALEWTVNTDWLVKFSHIPGMNGAKLTIPDYDRVAAAAKRGYPPGFKLYFGHASHHLDFYKNNRSLFNRFSGLVSGPAAILLEDTAKLWDAMHEETLNREDVERESRVAGLLELFRGFPGDSRALAKELLYRLGKIDSPRMKDGTTLTLKEKQYIQDREYLLQTAASPT